MIVEIMVDNDDDIPEREHSYFAGVVSQSQQQKYIISKKQEGK